MNFEMHTHIVSHDLEVRVDAGHNLFELYLDGYHVYPLEETISIYKTEKEAVGKAVPKMIVWNEGKTILRYQLVSLHSVN